MDANVGDLVVCVSRKAGFNNCVEPGKVFTVERVWDNIPDAETGALGTCYDLVGVARWGDEYAYGVKHFRKIDHDKTEACETEFVTLLKRERISA